MFNEFSSMFQRCLIDVSLFGGSQALSRGLLDSSRRELSNGGSVVPNGLQGAELRPCMYACVLV